MFPDALKNSNPKVKRIQYNLYQITKLDRGNPYYFNTTVNEEAVVVCGGVIYHLKLKGGKLIISNTDAKHKPTKVYLKLDIEDEYTKNVRDAVQLIRNETVDEFGDRSIDLIRILFSHIPTSVLKDFNDWPKYLKATETIHEFEEEK